MQKKIKYKKAKDKERQIKEKSMRECYMVMDMDIKKFLEEEDVDVDNDELSFQHQEKLFKKW